MGLENTKHVCQQAGITRRGFIKSMGVGSMALCLEHQLAQASEYGGLSESEVPAGASIPIVLHINQSRYRVLAETRWTLLFVLREKLGLTGSKEGCSRGECGACTVLMDGIPRYACMTLAVEAQEAKIETVEGLMQGEELGSVQEAFLQEDAFQCGYCTPGQVVAAEGLIRSNPDPDEQAVRLGMSGNLCRCGAYSHISRAVQKAAGNRSN
ncbi:MAG: (2Fe-2S)-binding protein [Desulfovermiculus sp.]|nr:(2Fe-2S)-binding protein [Desulfovermiculus sp.]